MKIQELIDELQKYKEMYGDLPVKVPSMTSESEDSILPIYGIIASFDAEGDINNPEEIVLCYEEFYYFLHDENT
jgi:hypothetical protein